MLQAVTQIWGASGILAEQLFNAVNALMAAAQPCHSSSPGPSPQTVHKPSLHHQFRLLYCLNTVVRALNNRSRIPLHHWLVEMWFDRQTKMTIKNTAVLSRHLPRQGEETVWQDGRELKQPQPCINSDLLQAQKALDIDLYTVRYPSHENSYPAQLPNPTTPCSSCKVVPYISKNMSVYINYVPQKNIGTTKNI